MLPGTFHALTQQLDGLVGDHRDEHVCIGMGLPLMVHRPQTQFRFQ